MIIGTILRNFKTYNGINYVPISHGPNFCGLVGNNGIGKSSVLEALDSFLMVKPGTIILSLEKVGSQLQDPILFQFS
jgi:ABC-type cobalamin/Fe3+-siderophores transport system ATPase subunit